jgi:hypothetical protein
MWDQQKRERYSDLLQREASGTLTKAERQELQRLTREIEDAETAYLHGATEQLRSERENLEAQNRALEALVNRKEALVARLRRVLAEAEVEREAIEEERARILGEGSRSWRQHGNCRPIS